MTSFHEARPSKGTKKATARTREKNPGGQACSGQLTMIQQVLVCLSELWGKNRAKCSMEETGSAISFLLSGTKVMDD